MVLATLMLLSSTPLCSKVTVYTSVSNPEVTLHFLMFRLLQTDVLWQRLVLCVTAVIVGLIFSLVDFCSKDVTDAMNFFSLAMNSFSLWQQNNIRGSFRRCCRLNWTKNTWLQQTHYKGNENSFYSNSIKAMHVNISFTSCCVQERFKAEFCHRS